MTTYTKGQVIEELRAVALAEAPGFTYMDQFPSNQGWEPCHYQVDGKPACIVGRMLSRLGVDVDGLRVLDQSGTGLIAHPLLLDNLRRNHNIEFTAEALAALNAAQTEQDNERTWDYALVRAIEAGPDVLC